MRWPRLSLTCLKLSRSRNSTVRPAPCAGSRSRAAERLISKLCRLGSSVTVSKWAMRLILHSAFRRSVTSWMTSTVPSLLMRWMVASRARPSRVSRGIVMSEIEAPTVKKGANSVSILGVGDQRGLDQLVKQGVHALPGKRGVGGQAEDSAKLVVGEDQAAVGVDHAQAVRHVVESRVEAHGQSGGLESGVHLRLEGFLEPRRGRFDKGEKRDEADNDHPWIPASGDQHGGARGTNAAMIWALMPRSVAKLRVHMPNA